MNPKSVVQITLGMLLVILVVALPPSWVRAATYYVDASGGSDNNAGTSESATWKTVAKVNGSSFGAGDSVLFKRGRVWRETLQFPSSGTSGNPITVGAYSTGADPVISAANLVSNWTGGAGSVWQATVATEPSVVTFDGNRGNRKASLSGLTSANDWFWASGVLYVFASSNPGGLWTNPGVEAGARGECITLHYRSYVRLQDLKLMHANEPSGGAIIFSGELGGAGNNEFLRLTIQNCAGHGIGMPGSSNNKVDSSVIAYVGGHGIYLARWSSSYATSGNTFSNNTVHDASAVGIAIYGYSNTDRATGNTVSGNTVYNSGDGVYLTLADGNRVFHNTLYSNRVTGSGGEGYGVGVCSSSANEIYENVMYGNRTVGMEVWGATSPWGRSDGNIITRNQIYSNTESGILFSSAYSNNNQVSYNLIRSNGTSGLVIGHANAGNTLYNNTVYGNAAHGLEFYNSPSGWTIRNNIISDNGGYAINAFSSANLVHDHNSFYKSSGALVAHNGSTYSATTIRTFEGTAVSANPLFVSPSTFDLRLQYLSPCVNTGVDVGLTKDFSGNAVPVGTVVDIGALEWRSASSLSAPRNLHIVAP